MIKQDIDIGKYVYLPDKYNKVIVKGMVTDKDMLEINLATILYIEAQDLKGNKIFDIGKITDTPIYLLHEDFKGACQVLESVIHIQGGC